VLDFDGSRRSRRRDAAIAAGILLLALFAYLLPPAYQQPIRESMRRTVLRPFLVAQERLAARRARTVDISQVRAQRDSLAALVAAQTTLSEENRRLRDLMGLGARAGDQFITAQVLRLGLTGAESTFMLDVGAEQGVAVGSPVIAAEGLVGVVWEVDARAAQAIEWTNPEFRVSAMTADGDAYGIVEARQGRFREEDLLVLTGAPFHSDIRPGRLIVTSGRGDLYPRGIPIGTVLGIEEADTGWRKSYLIRPAVRPEAVLHALVGVATQPESDLTALWNMAPAADTAAARARADTLVGR
jgi:rod shape-determining protein MreC